MARLASAGIWVRREDGAARQERATGPAGKDGGTRRGGFSGIRWWYWASGCPGCEWKVLSGGRGGVGEGGGGTLTVNEEPQLLVDSYCYSAATEGLKKNRSIRSSCSHGSFA
jgi:hypothetical protein